jgi:DNA polymerase/3'-5' exonuclease PolX
MDYPFDFAKQIADKIIKLLEPYCERICIAGSIRRECKRCKDIEVVYIPKTQKLYELQTVFDKWYHVKGQPAGKYQQFRLPEGIKLDLFRATFDNWGLILAIRTGSANFSHNVLAKTWVKKGYHSKDGNLYQIDTYCERNDFDIYIPIYEEEDLFKLLDLKWVKPKDRI